MRWPVRTWPPCCCSQRAAASGKRAPKSTRGSNRLEPPRPLNRLSCSTRRNTWPLAWVAGVLRADTHSGSMNSVMSRGVSGAHSAATDVAGAARKPGSVSGVAGVPAGSAPGTGRARPPTVRAASNTVTWRPACPWAMAAAMPAQPAPMTATFMDAGPRLRHPAERLHLPRQPELAQRREADALVQHLEVLVLDLAQQGAVDVGHHQAGLLGAAVGIGQQGEGLVVQAVRTLGLKAHQRGEAVGIRALQDLVCLHVELLQFADRQVDAA